MEKLKKNWLLLIIGLHIVLRFVFYNFITNDKVVSPVYDVTYEESDFEQLQFERQIVLKD